MTHPGYDAYSIDYCIRIERELHRRERAARAEYQRLKSASRSPYRRRLAGWLGVRLVAVGTWLCAPTAPDGSADIPIAAMAKLQKP